MTQKASALYEEGDDMGAGEAANMAKYAAAEAACDAADRAVQSHGGNGITQEYGVAGLLVAARAGRIAPVSREMILNFVGHALAGSARSHTDLHDRWLRSERQRASRNHAIGRFRDGLVPRPPQPPRI